MGSTYRRNVPDWPLQVNGKTEWLPVAGSVRAADGESLRRLAVAGVGLARLSRYHMQADIDAGRLVAVMEDFNPGDRAPIHAVYLGKPGRLPARVRVLLAFLAERVTQAVLDGAPPST
jgi:DNA-binding transcriptional LysR family regulator